MGMRVIIEKTSGVDPNLDTPTSCKIELYDPREPCSAERLGELIGYAISGIESFYVRGDVVEGIRDVIRDYNT